jgi:hypothetical protein
MNIILKSFSLLGIILGLIILIYFPFNIYFSFLSIFFIAWGIFSWLLIDELKKFSFIIKFFLYPALFFSIILIFFSISGLTIMSSNLLFNFLLLILFLGIFMLAWSVLIFKFLRKIKVNKNKDK